MKRSSTEWRPPELQITTAYQKFISYNALLWDVFGSVPEGVKWVNHVPYSSWPISKKETPNGF